MQLFTSLYNCLLTYLIATRVFSRITGLICCLNYSDFQMSNHNCVWMGGWVDGWMGEWVAYARGNRCKTSPEAAFSGKVATLILSVRLIT
ncbi:MAG: hypothetical protein HC769_29080 [Cyanobacteria bacterium CRU_2_1]|nr:hypothetical protein [Cyanobacteria bacterium RU_5_0]NJR62502.1 hypothetical protein [Cyanobacteria bacterium CRU_2_1]